MQYRTYIWYVHLINIFFDLKQGNTLEIQCRLKKVTMIGCGFQIKVNVDQLVNIFSQ